MLFNTTKDWKKYLSPKDEAILNEILELTEKHRGAYKNADDIKIAKLWCAIIELQKEISTLNTRLRKIEFILGGMISRAEEEKKKLLKSLQEF